MDELTAQGAADAGRIAFRLAAPTPLHDKPDVSSPVLETLPEDALVTVNSDVVAFLYVITAADRFGYIADETPVVSVECRPAVAGAPAVAPRSGVSPGAPARRWMDDMDAWNTPAMVPAARPGLMAAGDDSFTLARPLEPSERVLIYDRIGANKRSTFVLLAAFVVLLTAFFLAIGAFLTLYSGVSPGDEVDTSIRIGIAGFLIALAVGITMYFTAPAAVLMISGAHEVSKEEEPELYRIVENLSIGSGLPMPKVYVIEDSAPNALATGRDPQHAYVAATRGILDKLEKREMEAVMAHEMSHVGNYDIRIMTLVAVAVGLIAMIADLLMRFSWYGAGARSSNRSKGGGAIAMIVLVLAIVTIIVTPIVASLIRLALSRQREYLADASGALLCRNPDALADALEKISADQEPLEVANKATAHLYIANPLKGHESFLNNLFATHPPVAERIKLLRAMG